MILSYEDIVSSQSPKSTTGKKMGSWNEIMLVREEAWSVPTPAPLE